MTYTFSPPESPNLRFKSIEPNRWVGFLVAFSVTNLMDWVAVVLPWWDGSLGEDESHG